MKEMGVSKLVILFASLAGCAAILLPASPAAAAECRTAELPDGTPALFCKDKKGKWQQQKGDVETTAAAPNAVTARGQGTYRGTWIASSSPKKKKRGLNLGDLVDDAINPNASRYEGAVNFVLTFDGAAVTADVSGTGGMSSGKMTGVVRNGICRLTDVEFTIVYEGPCSQARFSGKITDTPSARNDVSGTFDTQSSDYVDESARDARRAELQVQCDAGSNAACVELDQQ